MTLFRNIALAVVSAGLLWFLSAGQHLETQVLAQSDEVTEGASEAEADVPGAGAAAIPAEDTSAPVGAAVSVDSTEDLGTVYNRKLHSVEERVNGLKENVFRSKARLLLLRETVLHGMVSGARGILYHVNELGGEYVIESITYFLDGSKIYSRADDTGDLARKKEIKFFDGGLPAGNHQVSANVVLRGNGFGIFSYLNQYTLKVQGSYSFIAQEGKVSRVKIIVYERGGFTQDFTERPYFRWEVQTDRNLPSSEDAP